MVVGLQKKLFVHEPNQWKELMNRGAARVLPQPGGLAFQHMAAMPFHRPKQSSQFDEF